jgi:predicted MFS family arabinose efflux permease
VFVVAYLAADEFAHDGSQTEATTWVNTVNNLGAAAGAAGAGMAADQLGGTAALIVGAAILMASALVVLAARVSIGTAVWPLRERM